MYLKILIRVKSARGGRGIICGLLGTKVYALIHQVSDSVDQSSCHGDGDVASTLLHLLQCNPLRDKIGEREREREWDAKNIL